MFQRFNTKKTVFYIIMLSIPFFFMEGLFRVYFATKVGPSVLLYGTMFSRVQKQFDPIGTMNRYFQKYHTVDFPENVSGNYSKYYPYQKRFTTDEFGNTFDVAINAEGFRGKDFNRTKQPGIVRIVTLGASSTFGYYNRDNETYPYYMEEMLNERIPVLNAQPHTQADEPIKAFEVINLGIPHSTSDQLLSMFMSEVLDFEPDIVTYYEGINDAAEVRRPDTATQNTKQAIKKIPFTNEIFRALRYRFLSVALVGLTISKSVVVEEFSEQDFQAHIQGKSAYYINNIQHIYEECRQRGILFIVANQQAKSLLVDRTQIKGVTYAQEQEMVQKKLAAIGILSLQELWFRTHNILMEELQNWAMANNVPFVDIISETDWNRQVLVSRVHLNSQGNRIIASAFADEILKQIRDRQISAQGF